MNHLRTTLNKWLFVIHRRASDRRCCGEFWQSETFRTENERMSHPFTEKNAEFDRTRRPRHSVAVLASGRQASIILRRLRLAGYTDCSVCSSAEMLLTMCETNSVTRVVAVLEPELLTRKTLQQLDERGMLSVGVVVNNRHRSWGRLLPLLETVWLFATPSTYRTHIEGYAARFARLRSG